MAGCSAALAKRSDARAQRRAQSQARREAATAGARGEVSVSGSSGGSRFRTVAANARLKLGQKEDILVDGAGKPYPKSSLLCLALNNPLRQAAIRTIRWPGSSKIDPSPASSPGSHGTSAVTWLDQSSARYTRLSAGRRGTLAQRSWPSLTTQPVRQSRLTLPPAVITGSF
jgi:hypothetical protein